MRKLINLTLTLILLLSLLAPAVYAQNDMAGKVVILHSNDVHGAIDGYAKLSALRNDYISRGAEVILADAGDYSQGAVAVSRDKGASAVTMMNAVGYDVVTLGNHEFDFGYSQLLENMKQAEFDVLCANILDESGKTVFDAAAILERGGVKIGFFGLETPEAQTKANPALIKGLTFLAASDMYKCAQEQTDLLRSQGADVVICLAHLGIDAESEPNTSYDLYANTTGIDLIIDAHSHTVMTEGPNGEPIQSTGTAFANIGVVVIDKETKTISERCNVSADELSSDPAVAAVSDKINADVEAEYGAVFAESTVDLDGNRAPGVRTGETNLGDLITDAMLWAIKKDADSLDVDADHIVAITNGGGIRASVSKGNVTKKDINTVLPFGNTLSVVYVSGNELLEALEASTYSTPTPTGSFPQISGMQIFIDASQKYDASSEPYPGSTYYGPDSINRVTVKSVAGKPFDPDAVYAVATNDFLASGGDTYYAFASAKKSFDTGKPLDEVLVEYISTELGGNIGDKYAAPHGSITVRDIYVGGLDNNVWLAKYGNVFVNCPAERFVSTLGFDWGDIVTVSFAGKSVDMPVVPDYTYVAVGEPAVIMLSNDDGTPKGYISFAINMGNFAETYGIAQKHTESDGTWYWTACEGITFPLDVTVRMKQHRGYVSEIEAHDLVRTNDRSDYAHLTDAQFANFRVIAATGMGKGILYRTSSPINPEIGRNKYADAAIKNAGVTVIMNLADTEEEARGYEGFSDSYYSGQKVVYLSLGVDFDSDEFKSGLAVGLKFFAENKGVYAVHCTEGKDRAGFVSALLECLMGATYDEITADYMTTYYNYYDVEKDDVRYNKICENNILATLSDAFGTDDLSAADLAECAERYIKSIGLSDAEVAALKSNLSADASEIPPTGDNAPVVAVCMLLVAFAAAAYTVKKRVF